MPAGAGVRVGREGAADASGRGCEGAAVRAGVRAEPAFGVYVHVPFCAARCDYCAFATWTDRHHLMAAYARACVAEVGQAVAEGMPEATSVFFGGGTPSLLPASLLLAILAAIPRCRGAEVTVECNPENVDAALLDAYLAGGVNRISLGVQSLVPHVLAGLGRAIGSAVATPAGGERERAVPAALAGAPDLVARAVALVGRAGYETFNVDLIYGGAGESDADWDETLARTLALEPCPPHVSAYALTVEPGTPLAANSARHPDDDVQAARYERADRTFAEHGLEWYELSNWSRPGHQCRHNQLYWAQGDYRGIGCAAHSHRQGRRWWNVRTPERYMAAREEGRSPVAGVECLDPSQQALERLQLALRTRAGVPASALAGQPAVAGLVDWTGPDGGESRRAVLSRRGRLLANEVSARLQVGSGPVSPPTSEPVGLRPARFS